MNIIKKIMGGLYAKSKKYYEEYRVAQLKKSSNIIFEDGVRVFETCSLEAATYKSIKIGKNSAIRGRIVTFPNGGTVQIGSECYIGENTQIWSEKKIEIGNRVLIAHNCNIFDSSTHPLDKNERHEQYMHILSSGFPTKEYKTLKKNDIYIKDDAWIAADVTVMKGVTIGEGAIVSAGSVVISDIPPYTIVAGNPAKVIRKLG